MAAPSQKAKTDRGDRRLVGTAAKTLAILDRYATGRTEWGVTELSVELGTHKGSVHRILQELVRWGFLDRNPQNQRYRLGMRFLDLAAAARSQVDLSVAAADAMQELARRTGGTVTVRILDRGELVVVNQVDSPQHLKVSYTIGSRLPCNFGASGKVLLAHLPERELDELLAAGRIPRLTSRTIVDEQALKAHLAEVRERGYAKSSEEALPGARGVAAPIRRADGAVIAALGVSMPKEQLPMSELDRTARLAVELANQVSRKLGGA